MKQNGKDNPFRGSFVMVCGDLIEIRDIVYKMFEACVETALATLVDCSFSVLVIFTLPNGSPTNISFLIPLLLIHFSFPVASIKVDEFVAFCMLPPGFSTLFFPL